jgi:hypothetical protein
VPDNGLEGFREYELLPLIEELLPSLVGTNKVFREPVIGGSSARRALRPDFVGILEGGKIALIEVKGVTPNTRRRLEDAASQLVTYRDSYKEANPGSEVVLVLVTPGTLSEDYRRFLQKSGIDQIIDGDVIQKPENMPILERFLEAMAGPRTAQSASVDLSESLLKELREIPAGHADWSEYQKLCERILEFLFCPPLEKPIYERSNRARSDRRDIILPNYVTDPEHFWAQMRSLYQAHFVVVDAKNWSSPINKGEVLKIANYLQLHGAGRFGMIMSRKGGDSGADVALREHWRSDQKMIVILNDAEVEQMLAVRRSRGNPALLVRQKIEDFRLSF